MVSACILDVLILRLLASVFISFVIFGGGGGARTSVWVCSVRKFSYSEPGASTLVGGRRGLAQGILPTCMRSLEAPGPRWLCSEPILTSSRD